MSIFLFAICNGKCKLTGLANALQTKTANTAEAKKTDREIILTKSIKVINTECLGDVALPEVN